MSFTTQLLLPAVRATTYNTKNLVQLCCVDTTQGSRKMKFIGGHNLELTIYNYKILINKQFLDSQWLSLISAFYLANMLM